MDGRWIGLADGTRILEAECGYANNVLWCYLKNTDIATAFYTFSDANKTSKIIFQYGEESVVYDGYTVMTAIYASLDGDASVALRRPEGYKPPEQQGEEE